MLYSVIVARRIGGAKIERPEIYRIVRLRIDHAKRNPEKAALNGLAPSHHVNLDRSVPKVITVEPRHTHAFALAELERALSFGVDDRRRAAGDLPARVFADGRQIQIFRRLRPHGRGEAREHSAEAQCHVPHRVHSCLMAVSGSISMRSFTFT